MTRTVVLVLGALVSTVALAALTAQAQAPLIVAYMESNGELVPIARCDGARWRNTWPEFVPSSTADDKVPRDTPIGILRLGVASIWAMSEWGKESQTIVLFDVAVKRVRKLTSADISGC